MSAIDVIENRSNWSLDCGDCLDLLAMLPEASVDLCLFSPPYEQARLYLENGQDMGIARNTEDWVAWMVKVFRACLRVTRGLVACVCEGQTVDFRYSCGPALLMADLHRARICLRKPPLYVREGIPGSGGPDWLKNKYEWVICATNGGKLAWSENTAMGHKPAYARGGRVSNRDKDGERAFNIQTRRRKDGKRATPTDADIGRPLPDLANPGNLIDCGANTHFGMGNQNEAPFPEALAEFFIRSFCPPNGIALDPFSGSGTTCDVAVAHGRRAIGMDLRESQIRLAEKRLSTVTPFALFT